MVSKINNVTFQYLLLWVRVINSHIVESREGYDREKNIHKSRDREIDRRNTQ